MKLISKLFPLLFIVAFAACKKDSDNTTQPSNTNTNPPPTTSVLCDGSSSKSHYPLALGNKWTIRAEVGNGWTETEVKAPETLGGKAYFTMSISDVGVGFTEYLRMDGNGDVYRYEKSLTKEFMEIPASPTANQEWDYPCGSDGLGKRKVVSTTVQVKTSKCTYTNCVSIQEYDGTGDKLSLFYYKKGLGLVKKTVFSSYVLPSVTLK
jgi:hypothetical protein